MAKTVAAISLILAVALNFSTCTPRFDCANTTYNFEIGVKAYPDEDSIHVGDTIWFEINESTALKDIQSGKIIDYSGAINLGSAIGFGKYMGINNATEAANSFNYILITGILVNNPNTLQIREFLFVQQNDRYLFKLGIIPKEVGVFGVGFSNAANVYRKNDACTKANFTINFKGTNQHYYLNPNFQGGPPPTGGDYYFKVN